MENLTVSQRVVKDHPAEPLAGHVVVVFERLRDGGEVHRFEIKPDDPPPRAGLLNAFGMRSQRYFGFAVTQTPELRYTFTEHVALDDHVHEIDVTYDLTYRAVDPTTLVTLRGEDPLRRVVAEIARLMNREIAALAWDVVKERFRDAEAHVWARTQAHLKQHAAKFGLEIDEVTLKSRISEDDSAIERGRKEAEIIRAKKQREVELKLDDVEHESRLRERQLTRQQELAELEAQAQGSQLFRRQRQAVTDALVKALENVAGNTRTAAELRDAVVLAMEAAQATAPRMGKEPRVLGMPVSPAGYLPSANGGATRLVTDILAELEHLACSFAQKKALQSAVLRLVAELLDEAASEPTLAACAEKVRKLVSELEPPPSATQFKFFQSLSRYHELRDHLS